MRDLMERVVLLPFTVGCISESSIAVGIENVKRSKIYTSSTLTRIRERRREEDEEEEEYLDDEESLSGENMKNPLSLLALPRFQKLFKNFKSSLFAYKDDLEPETGMEIGAPTDVKHVTHIGLDGCASSILSRAWNNLAENESIDLASFTLTPVELSMATQAETPLLKSQELD